MADNWNYQADPFAPYSDLMAELSPEDLESGKATAGEALAPGTVKATEEVMIEAARTVYDPEIPVNIYDLGLIYELDQAENGDLKVIMTLTTPACPVAGAMPYQVANTLAALPGVGAVEVELVWDPPWTPERMSEDAKMLLDMW